MRSSTGRPLHIRGPTTTRRRTLALAAVLAVGVAESAGAAPSAVAWERWRAHDETSRETIDHTAWTRFLQRYVVEGEDGIHRVRYGGVTAEHRGTLDAYIDRLASTPISRFRRVEQLAYWIDLYNALTIQVVLDHYPVSSIRDISLSPGLFSSGPWGRRLIEVEGEPISLDDIEHRILRPLWKDPRIHYAVNCASLGCPNLMREAFTAESVDRLLEAGVRAYVNHPRGVSLENGDLTVSSIYSWFAEDFGGEAGVLAHLRRYAGPELAARLVRLDHIDDHSYDWALNDRGAEPRG